MHELESTSGKLARALVEDLALERDRVRARFADLFVEGGFAQPEFSRTVLSLAKAKGLLPVLWTLARPWISAASPQDFEQHYSARLVALATGEASPPKAGLPIDLFDYINAALPVVPVGFPALVPANAAQVETLLRFLEAVATDPALVLFRKSIPEMPPTKDGGPGTILVPAAPASAAVETPPPAAQVSRVVGSYQILEEIGRGGMGTVHVAYHTLLRKRFAIKILRNLPTEGEERDRAVKRFTREAWIYHELAHPNIVRLHEIFPHEGELLIVMEYVAGPNLGKVLSVDRRLPPARVLRIGIDVGEALQAARAKDIIHRDPKPANILVAPDGHYKITDFGIARIVRETEETRVTEERSVLGTVGYMSPEAIRGEEVDEQADIYSLGAVLYHAATGVIPGYAPDPSSMMYHTLHKEPRPISVTVEQFPPRLEAIILRCLKKSKSERYSGYPELLDALYEARNEIQGKGSGGPEEAPARNLGTLLLRIATAFGAAVLGMIGWAIFTAEVPEAGKGLAHVTKPVSAPESAKTPNRPGDPGRVPPEAEPLNSVESPPPSREVPSKDASKESAPSRKVDAPAPTLREKLLASPASEGAVRLMGEVLGRFEKHYSEITSLSYQGLAQELGALGQGENARRVTSATSEERAYFEATLAAGRKLVSLADGAFRSRLAELRASTGPVSLRLRDGGTASGTLEGTTGTAIVLRQVGGSSSTIPLSKISPDEFRPKAAPATSELAYLALSAGPAKTLPALVELSEKDEEVLHWLPIVVRLARLEVEHEAREAALQAKPVLVKKGSPESSTAALARTVGARAALGHLEKCESRVIPLFGWLDRDLARCRRENAALELLFHGQLSKVAAGHRDTAAGPVAAEVLLEGFERDITAGSDELLAGTGWFNWRWELRPWDKDPLVRTQYLQPGPTEGPLVLQDAEGPRSLVMNDATSRAPEGLLIRVKLEPMGGVSDRAEWRLHLLPEKTGTSYLRVSSVALEVYRSSLTPGSTDERLLRAPLTQSGSEPSYRSYAFVPGGDYLHVFADRELVLSIPRADGTIPKQLSFTVYHAKASIKNFQAKQAAAPGGGPRK